MLIFSQRNLAISFIIAMLILLMVTVISYRTTQRFVSTARQVEHTHEVVRGLDLLQADLLKAEYANRNYVITGDETNVDEYQTFASSVNADLENLRRLTSDNPKQRQRLDGLQPVVTEKLTVMGKINDFQRVRNLAEIDSIRPRGTFLREEAFRRLEEMKEEDRKVLNEQSAYFAADEQKNKFLSLAGFAVSFALLLVVFYLLNHDITDRKRAEQVREKLIKELEVALTEVKTLRGFIPICSYCKNIRDDKDFWQGVESYVSKHTEAQFSHSICPDCYKKIVQPQLDELKQRKEKG